MSVAAKLAALAAVAAALGAADAAYAKDPEVAAEIRALKALVEAQAQQLAEQSRTLDEQRRRLDLLTLRLAVFDDDALDSARATGAPVPSAAGAVFAVAQAAPVQVGAAQGAERPAPLIPARPVGEAPPEREPATVQQEVLPEGMGVTLPRGTTVLEPSLEYVRSSNNRLVFRGQPIAATIFNGVFEVSDADRDTVVGALSARYGLTSRLELEVRVPYLYRNDVVVNEQSQPSAERGLRLTSALESSGLGDVEAGARYQLTRGLNGKPIWLAGLRVKSDTGKGPLDVAFDPQNGIATELATGSGYWSVEPSITALLPSDPVVLFASVGYAFNLERKLNRVLVEERANPTPPNTPRILLRSFDPGDSVNFGFGFGFAVNERFSYTLSYRHSVVMETETIFETGPQSTPQLQVGSLTLSGSYRLTPKTTVNLSVDVGVTDDAPDLRLGVRVPYRF